MQWRTFIIGWILAVAVLLFAQRRSPEPTTFAFRDVIDLTHKGALAVSGDHLDASAFGTRMDAPIHRENGAWAAESVAPERLVAPLVVMDLSARATRDPSCTITLSDIADWEQTHGHVPAGAVVIARTGFKVPLDIPKEPLAHCAYSRDAVDFLVRARSIYAVGIDAPGVDRAGDSEMPVRQYLGRNHVYSLANVANLDDAPASGAMIVVAPTIIRNAAGAPVRLLALVR